MSVHSASSVYNPGQRILPTAGPRVLLGNVEFQEETAEGSSPSFISLRIFKGPALDFRLAMENEHPIYQVDWLNRPSCSLEHELALAASKQAAGRVPNAPCSRCARNPNRRFRNCVVPMGLNSSGEEARCVNCLVSKDRKGRCLFCKRISAVFEDIYII